jgi:L-ribulose-5-phosphate 3-epimerase
VPVPHWKIALDLEALRVPFRRALATAADLGVRAVELCARGELTPGALSRTGLRHMRKLLDDHSLRVVAVRCLLPRGFSQPDDPELESRVAAVESAMNFAGGLGAETLLAPIGPVPTQTDSQPGQLLREVLDRLGRHGHRTGALLTVETGSNSGPEMAALLSTIGEGLVGVDFDPGRLLMRGHSVPEAVETLGRWVLAVHVTDARRRLQSGQPELTPAGGGEADFPALLASLDERGYRGAFIVRPIATHDPLAEAAAAIRYLSGL